MHETDKFVLGDALFLEVITDQNQPELSQCQFDFKLFVLLPDVAKVGELIEDLLEVLEVHGVISLHVFLEEAGKLLF
jgi:hypothetical protein